MLPANRAFSIQQEFSLSHGAWGGIYMAGTLLIAALLPWAGAGIDRLPLGRYTAMVVAAMVFAAAFMALVPAASFLIAAVFLLRVTGQGLASHAGTTAMARHFGAHRGKAVADQQRFQHEACPETALLHTV